MDEFSRSKLAAVAAMARGEWANAASKLEYCRELDPGDPAALYDLAACQTRLELFDAALRTLNELEALASGFTGVLRAVALRSFIELQLEDFLAAEATLSQALQRYPENQSLLAQWAFVCERTDRLPAAQRAYERLLELNPDDLNALNGWAYVQARLGQNIDKALVRAARLLKERGENAAYLDTFAALLARQGNTNQARQALEKGLKLSGGHPLIRRHLAELGRGFPEHAP